MKGPFAMSKGAKDLGGSPDQVEIWKRWVEASWEMWSPLLGGDQEAPVNPQALYDIWLRSVSTALEYMKAGVWETTDIRDAWGKWLEAWQKSARVGNDSLNLALPWLGMMEEASSRMFSGKTMPADPLTWFMQWYEGTSEKSAKAVGDIIGTEQFIQVASQFLESYASIARTLRRTNEAYFSNLQLATRSDIARVAGLVIALEEKVDRFEDIFDDFTDASVNAPSHHLEVTLEGRLKHLESKLDALSAKLEKIERVQERAKHLDQLENKLDRVLESIAKLETKESATSAPAARRKPRGRSVSSPEVKEPLSE
jgi:polyhydroxyalkanoic acid synthase PhaR subunit